MADRSCSIEGCNRRYRSRGYCSKHYDEFIPSLKKCSVEGCAKPYWAKNLCRFHYQRKSQGINLNLPIRGPRQKCLVENCNNMNKGHGYCDKHLTRLRKWGDATVVKGTRETNKGRLKHEVAFNKNKDGYMCGSYKGKMVFQHRVVWENHYGRALRTFESIHHINGIRSDNRIENLELWVKPQPSGQRVEDLVGWLIEHYPEVIIEKLSRSKK